MENHLDIFSLTQRLCECINEKNNLNYDDVKLVFKEYYKKSFEADKTYNVTGVK